MDSTLVAAVITAALAGIGLTLSKDTKVSEFRQKWADALRKDVSEFLALVSNAWSIKHQPQQIINVANAEKQLTRLNIVMYRVLLRLYLKKKAGAHWKLGEAMWAARQVALSPVSTKDEMNKTTEGIQEAAATVIDDAWEKVKMGEGQYRIVKWVCYASLAVSVVLLFGQAIYKWRKPSSEAITHIKIDEPLKVNVQTPPQPPVVPQKEPVPAPRPQPSTSHRSMGANMAEVSRPNPALSGAFLNPS